MISLENITGKKIFDALRQLQKNKRLISMRFIDYDDEELTIITDIQSQKYVSFLVIEKPERLKQAATRGKLGKIEFQYFGEDGLLYSFITSEYKIFHRDMWVKFPDAIERHQRRNYFRLGVSPRTKLKFYKNAVPAEMLVMNISMGGSLGTILLLEKENDKGGFLKTDDEIEGLELVISGVKPAHIQINKARVIRLDQNDSPTRNRYAIEFLSIDKPEEKLLTEAIYNLQRQYLQKRRSLRE